MSSQVQRGWRDVADPLLLCFVPLLLLIGALWSLPAEGGGKAVRQQQAFPVTKFRTVVLLLDSVGTDHAFDPALMPFVSSLTSTSLFGEARACPAKATFPCIKSLFEGRSATTGTALQDFSAVMSHRTTWPRSLAGLGLRLVVSSDHTLNRLYPDAFVDAMNYETLDAPLLERDAYAFARARSWLDDASIDVLLLHIIGTDKVSHESPVGSAVYRAKYREVDDFAREVAARLRPEDYLFVVGDHGHNAVGGHTDNAAYIAHGPIFPRGKKENLSGTDMLFLLSIPYGLTLPHDYEGQIRTDLTTLDETSRHAFLTEQARLWQIESSGLSDTDLAARLNDHVAAGRMQGEQARALLAVQREGPWIMAAAVFLLAMLGRRDLKTLRARMGGGAYAIAALCVCIIALMAFWIEPSWLKWYQHLPHQPLAFVCFYSFALLAGVIVTFLSDAASLRQHLARILWTVGVCVWLFAYFGPYASALPGQSAKVILACLVPAAVLIAGGLKVFRSPATLLLAGVLPFLFFHTESFNIRYRLTDWIDRAPLGIRLTSCLVLAVIWTWAFRLRENPRRALLAGPLVFIASWTLVSLAFFEFDVAHVIGVLLGALSLAGALELFRRARLPLAWSALAGVVLLYVTLHFVLNGFALSHVDFRFAAHKIIPFAEEARRAPQLIGWTLLKYWFVLLPAFAVLFKSGGGTQLVQQLLQLGWWREWVIVLSALGLALFDRRGLEELCGEEIYFWTFLTATLCLFCVAELWRERRRGALGQQAETRAVAFSAAARKLRR